MIWVFKLHNHWEGGLKYHNQFPGPRRSHITEFPSISNATSSTFTKVPNKNDLPNGLQHQECPCFLREGIALEFTI